MYVPRYAYVCRYPIELKHEVGYLARIIRGGRGASRYYSRQKYSLIYLGNFSWAASVGRSTLAANVVEKVGNHGSKVGDN